MIEPEHRILNIPQQPGVYFFKKGDEILYIGKATNLLTRTRSYFSPSLMEARGPLLVKMLLDATTIEWKTTDSVLEALLMESFLIKRHQPPYNSKEKDNKSYHYIVITDEEFPRIFPVRKRSLDTIYHKKIRLLQVFGPFPQGTLLKDALDIIRKIFPFYGKRGKGSYSEDFYQQLALIPGAHDEQAKERYLENIGFITDFFNGKKASIIQVLTKKMNAYAAELKFEQAQVNKQQIYALTHIRDMALMRRDFELGTIAHAYRIEAYDVAHFQGSSMIGVMVVHQGNSLDPQEYRSFSIRDIIKANDTAALEQMLSRRFQHSEWQFPDLIVVDGGIAQKNRAQKFLREQNLSIPVVAVVKDERHKAKGIMGLKKIIEKRQSEILAVNAEAHRFSISLHRRKEQKRFILE
jgi:excinuclease ABC subunit C